MAKPRFKLGSFDSKTMYFFCARLWNRNLKYRRCIQARLQWILSALQALETNAQCHRPHEEYNSIASSSGEGELQMAEPFQTHPPVPSTGHKAWYKVCVWGAGVYWTEQWVSDYEINSRMSRKGCDKMSAAMKDDDSAWKWHYCPRCLWLWFFFFWAAFIKHPIFKENLESLIHIF